VAKRWAPGERSAKAFCTIRDRPASTLASSGPGRESRRSTTSATFCSSSARRALRMRRQSIARLRASVTRAKMTPCRAEDHNSRPCARPAGTPPFHNCLRKPGIASRGFARSTKSRSRAGSLCNTERYGATDSRNDANCYGPAQRQRSGKKVGRQKSDLPSCPYFTWRRKTLRNALGTSDNLAAHGVNQG